MRCLRVFVLLGALAVPGWAEDAGDAPDHGVARISVLSGDVTVRRGDTGEFVAAELNAPLVALDHVLTDDNARAEIQLDWANFVRLAPDSEVRLAELADRDFLIQVSAGTVTFRVLRDSSSQVEISTPTLAIRPRLQGTYRVTVREDSSTEVTVRTGEAEIFAGNHTDFLRAGQTLFVSGDPADPQRIYRAAISRDEWDRWNEARDRDLDRPDSYKYVSRDIYGAEDLVGHGRWVYDPPYGWVWVPDVHGSWAPYRVGRWTWVNYYGWTWVSGDPWGWAPYHYGRWYHAPRYGWVWYPGEVRVRYYWRPALVAFFGWGVNVGWVSLAPYEVYRPWYGSGRTIVNNVTIVNNINVVGTYRNARFVSGRNGVTSVVSGDFGRRRITVNNFVDARDRDLQRAGDASRWLPREPSRENRQFSDRQVSARVSSRRETDRDFVSTRSDRNRRDGNRGLASPAENVRRADAPQRNEAITTSPRGESDRGRQPEGNRGRGESAAGATAPNRTQPARPAETRQAEGARGRGENSAPAAASNRPETTRRVETPQRNEGVVFPRTEPERARQPEGNRGRGEVSPSPSASNRTDNARRTEAPQRTEGVVFPRTEQERARPESNRGRGGNSNGNGNSSVAARPSEPVRRAETPQRNEGVVFPRSEPERARQPESNQGRASAPARREPEPVRSNPSPEVFRRAEPSRPSAESAPAPGRSPSGGRPEAVQRPQAESRPGRSAEREQPRESPRSVPAQAPRAESRSNAPAPQPAPQASAPAPSSSSPSPSPSQGNNGGGRGRGRDR